MSCLSKDAVLAVDGGGTRSRFALVVGPARFAKELGPANASTDFDGAARCVAEGIAALAKQAGTPVEALYPVPAFVGLAGLFGDKTQQKFSEKLPLTRVHYDDDRRAAVRGALGPGDGFVAHAGTGSFFARQRDGAMTFSGGWGSILGDEASAYWLGRRALAAVLRHVDGRVPCPGLAQEVLGALRDAEGIVAFARGATPEDVAAFAQTVTALARAGDPMGRKLVLDGAASIAQDLDRLGWQTGQAICLTGGLAPQYAPFLPAPKRAALTPPQARPIDGALALAQQIREDANSGS